jgi:hypothetical protein
MQCEHAYLQREWPAEALRHRDQSAVACTIAIP